MKLIKTNQSWVKFGIKATCVTLLLCAAAFYMQSRFQLGIDGHVVRCLDPYKVFLIDKRNTTPKHEYLFAFYAENMAPYHKDGAVVVKQIVGMPGDNVRVTSFDTFVNGKRINTGSAMLAEKLGKDSSYFHREFVLKDGEYFFMGWNPRSFDSRYWGVVTDRQLIGKASAVF